MRWVRFGVILLVAGAFLAGFLSHLLYQQWSSPPPENRVHPATFSPIPPSIPEQSTVPTVEAIDLAKIRKLAGRQAKVQGRIYRVGHSAKSNTYFLNFGPSRSSFTAVIFDSSVELFEKRQIHPKSYEGKEVELEGRIKDHPEYGLEMIIEEPAQIRVLK